MMVAKDLVLVCFPVSWAQGSSYLAILLEPVVVYYIIAEVSCQGVYWPWQLGNQEKDVKELEP